jgi:hypothetical protein
LLNNAWLASLLITCSGSSTWASHMVDSGSKLLHGIPGKLCPSVESGMLLPVSGYHSDSQVPQ